MIEKEDIVEELLNWAYIIEESKGAAQLVMLSGEIFSDAADEIEWLRAAGDALAAAMRSGSDAGWDAAIDAWEDARRG